MSKKILIVTDDSGESFEILFAVYRFREAGLIPVIAATKKKTLNGVIHDFAPGWNTYIEKPGYLINADIAISKVKAKDYTAMVLIGGRAPEFLRHNKSLVKLVKQFHTDGKGLFAICHGIQVLIAAGLCEGRKMTCYCNVRLEVELAGGQWVNKQSVVDGPFITAQTWESHAEFYRDIFKYLDS
ncbi:MAG: DJ-1/PfpI/YhbO family deglycase/protease [Verrucomicrobiae bacterium]|nr:DJ-1/PfpI/YhbO family deglycase/protease [Verrucomicrobiae bacterium]